MCMHVEVVNIDVSSLPGTVAMRCLEQARARIVTAAGQTHHTSLASGVGTVYDRIPELHAGQCRAPWLRLHKSGEQTDPKYR